MLGISPPEAKPERRPGRLGVEDRIVRLGLVGASLYYAARIGWTHPVGLLLGLMGVYLLITGLLGRDPIYRLAGWDTRMPEQGR